MVSTERVFEAKDSAPHFALNDLSCKLPLLSPRGDDLPQMQSALETLEPGPKKLGESHTIA